MFSSDQLNQLAKDVMNKLDPACNNGIVSLTTTQALAILALLAGTLEVTSVVVDRTQGVQLVLSGTLVKKEENEMDKIMKQLSHMPFDEVMKAMLGRFK
ncbi:hypothetical protein [Natronincola ferrireducens]|uniref:Uncharacterized protein n=1 Tax=Natronincola ferrireducens TaxID=393762 RepID=A0A1G9FA36_9FIRM|nr:hypothetical protein [Natronincola ferrireducens]SDK85246.1 hypothetical protein SAMN05660472_02132 [Natronincola ferrireducens]